MTRHKPSTFYYCAHVTPSGQHCSNTIEVIGTPSEQRAALERVDWRIGASLREVYCRRHNG